MSHADQLYPYETLNNFIIQHILILTFCGIIGNIFFSWHSGPYSVKANPEPRLHDHTQLNTPRSSTPLDERSARQRDST